MIGQDHKQVMVKHGSNFVKVHVCSLVKISKVIFEDKSKKVISKELKNENEIEDNNVTNGTEKTVSVVKDIAEAQDENTEVTTEISSEAEEVQEVGEEEKNNGRMLEKRTDKIEQPIVEDSEVSKRPISKGRNTVTYI